jgi:DUF1680 family protein
LTRACVLLLLLARPAAAAAPDKPEEVLRPFAYADVDVTGGPMAEQARGARGYFLALDEDSLLQGFRLRAGLPAPGKPMGGWYDPDGFAAAHPFGQYVSALARMYANTGDARYKEKVDRLVRGFHAAMGPDGFFYASAKVAKEWPCYVYDKNATGMRDAYALAGSTEALAVLSRMTDWAEKNLPRRSDEWYTLSEGLYKSYDLTHEARYLKMAAEFDNSAGFYDLFAAGVDAFTPALHAYSHVNSLLSAGQAYASTGDRKYLRAIVNAWNFLTRTQMYASGGWGADEHFVTAGSGQLAASLKTSERGFETPCGAYANVNLDRQLLRFTGESKYGDNMERVLLNGMLAALPPRPDGRSFYYSEYQAGARKRYFQYAWPCCSGTYAQITADYPLDLYFRDAEGVYVNLFAPSRLRWNFEGRAITLEQRTAYPLSNATTLIVRSTEPARFALSVRVPAWTAAAPVVSVNGAPLRIDAAPGAFLRIRRRWSDGDVVEVSFPMTLRFDPIDARTPDRAALMYGPLMLVALADKDVALAGDPAHPESWIKPAGSGPFRFRADGGATFRPFYLIRDERYTTYCRLSRPAPRL